MLGLKKNRTSLNTNHRAVECGGTVDAEKKHFIKYEISPDLLVWDEQHFETNSRLIKMSLQMKPQTSACLILIRFPLFFSSDSPQRLRSKWE